jgi:Big-like domain-containing protein/leishmanolysin
LSRIGVWLSFGAAALGAGCSNSTEPTTGTLEVATATSGVELDGDGYTLTVDAQPGVAIAPSTTVRLNQITSGSHVLTLGGLSPNCAVVGANPRTATVTPGGIAATTFSIACKSTSGTLEISARTSGPAPDSNGYVITIDGAERRAIGNNTATVLQGLAVGDYLVGLGGVAENCRVQDSNPRSVSILAGETTTEAFSVTCATTTLVVTTTTSGSGVDPDGYAFSIDGEATRSIGVDSSVTLSGRTPGSHSVQLSDLAAVCTVRGMNPVPVTLEIGKTTEAGFAVTCDGTGAPAAIVKVSGDNQSGRQGVELSQPLVVQVLDAAGDPLRNVSVLWTLSGGGSVRPENATTDAQGLTSASWTLGTIGVSSVQATLSEPGIAGNPVTFNAIGIGSTGFNIALRFLESPTPAQLQAFAEAAARWESVVTGDLPDNRVVIPAGGCGNTSPQLDEMVDDVLILIALHNPNGFVADAGPCNLRDQSLLPILGLIQIDIGPLGGQFLVDIISHEMGHVLGIGVGPRWRHLLSGTGGPDPHFIGAQAVSAFNSVGGNTYTLGEKVPVQNIGSVGAHWRQSVFRNELMASGTNSTNPLSIVTVAALADLGYQVDFSQADPYTLPAALRSLTGGPAIDLGDDLIRGPVRVVDAHGRVTRTMEQ